MIDPKHTAFVDGPDKPSVYINYVPTWDFTYAQFADRVNYPRPRTVDFQKDTNSFNDQGVVVYIPFGFDKSSTPMFVYKGSQFEHFPLYIVRIVTVYKFSAIKKGYTAFSIEPFTVEEALLTEIRKNATIIIKQIEKDQEVIEHPSWSRV